MAKTIEIKEIAQGEHVLLEKKRSKAGHYRIPMFSGWPKEEKPEMETG